VVVGARALGAELIQPRGGSVSLCPRSRQIRKLDNPIFSEQGGLLRSESIDAQICALPPSTKSSMPVMKLESSEARNRAALATSSASPMRPIGMVDKILAIAS
jgi:hypothetical protein